MLTYNQLEKTLKKHNLTVKEAAQLSPITLLRLPGIGQKHIELLEKLCPVVVVTDNPDYVQFCEELGFAFPNNRFVCTNIADKPEQIKRFHLISQNIDIDTAVNALSAVILQFDKPVSTLEEMREHYISYRKYTVGVEITRDTTRTVANLG